MARTLSLRGTRAAHADGADGEVYVTLVEISHPSLPEPIRLSSDPTERITTDPLVYGTRRDGEVYEFALTAAQLPDDEDGALPTVTLGVEVPGAETIKLLRSIPVGEPATAWLGLVLAATPDVLEAEYDDLEVADTPLADGLLKLVMAHADYYDEPWPRERMTAGRFPGLRRQ